MQKPQPAPDERLIYQGDLYWACPSKATGPTQRILHPHVVLQADLFNHSRIDSVVVCALSTNAKIANEPGNLVLEIGEANLEKRSVVVVSQLSALPKAELGEYIGTLSAQRVQQILAGIRFQQTAFLKRRLLQ
jgi:mRNA interferase MazF